MWGKACGVLERVFFALYRRQILTKSKLIASIQKIASPVARPGDSPKHECAIQVGFWLSCLITLNQEYSVQRENGQTRKRIDAIVDQLSDCKILETNIVSHPSKKNSEYPNLITSPFDFGLRACRPKVIIDHRTDAVRHLTDPAATYHLFPCKHFIYGGNARTSEIVSETICALQLGPAGPRAGVSNVTNRTTLPHTTT